MSTSPGLNFPASMTPVNPSGMADVYSMLYESISNRIRRLVAKEQRVAVWKYLTTLLLTTRFYLIKDVFQLEKEWEKIRESEDVLDFVLGVSNDFRMRLSESEYRIESLIHDLAGIYGTIAPDNASCAVDKALRDRLGTVSDLEKLYQNNIWFVTLLLLDQSGTELLNSLRPEPSDTTDGKS